MDTFHDVDVHFRKIAFSQCGRNDCKSIDVFMILCYQLIVYNNVTDIFLLDKVLIPTIWRKMIISVIPTGGKYT